MTPVTYRLTRAAIAALNAAMLEDPNGLAEAMCSLDKGHTEDHLTKNGLSWQQPGRTPPTGFLAAMRDTTDAVNAQQAQAQEQQASGFYGVVLCADVNVVPAGTRLPPTLSDESIARAAAIPLVPAFPPDYATTYRGFDERVRKIVAEMAPKAKVVTDWTVTRLAAPDEDDSEMFAWIDFGHGVTRQETWFGSHSRDSVWVATQGIPLLRELITDAQLEIGRRGTR